MSRHKNRLKKLEARAKPDTYRRHCFIPWERREPLTASEWVELNDIYEDAHQAFQAELARGKVRLLSRGDFRALLKECEAERDFRKLLSIVLEPDVYLFDSGTWDFIKDEAKLERALEITQKYLRYQALNDPGMCHRLFPNIEKRHESRSDRIPTKADFLELAWGRMHGQSIKVECYLELAESYCRASGFTQAPEQGSQGVTSTVNPSRMSKVMIVDSDGQRRG